MEKSVVRELKVGQIVLYKASHEFNNSPIAAYGVVVEVNNKAVVKWFDTDKETTYAFNTIHRLLREGMLEIVSH
jgi:hypothetical protein